MQLFRYSNLILITVAAGTLACQSGVQKETTVAESALKLRIEAFLLTMPRDDEVYKKVVGKTNVSNLSAKQVAEIQVAFYVLEGLVRELTISNPASPDPDHGLLTFYKGPRQVKNMPDYRNLNVKKFHKSNPNFANKSWYNTWYNLQRAYEKDQRFRQAILNKLLNKTMQSEQKFLASKLREIDKSRFFAFCNTNQGSALCSPSRVSSKTGAELGCKPVANIQTYGGAVCNQLRNKPQGLWTINDSYYYLGKCIPPICGQ